MGVVEQAPRPRPTTTPPHSSKMMLMKTLKPYLALAVMAAAVSMAAGARQLSQIDIPETDLLSTGVELGSSVFVPSLSFLDLGSVFTGLLQGPIGAAGGFLDEGLQPL